LVVLGLSLVLLLQLIYSGVSLAMLSEPEAVAPIFGGTEDMQLAAVERVTEVQRDEMSARPLFSVTRQPPATQASEATAKGRRQLRDVELLGVFGSGGTAGVIALVEDRQQRILLGEDVQGWTLEAVHPDRVEFARQGRQATVPLRQRQIKASSPREESRQSRATDSRQRQGAEARSARRGNNENGARPPARLGFGRSRR
jgi:hypothetical protein